MSFYIFIPGLFFIFLLIGETFLPSLSQSRVYHRWDWILNLTGFMMQGLVVPFTSYLIATALLPHLWPSAKSSLPLNWSGAFALNFIGVDFLFYWQHRLFHRLSFAWHWHQCHHASARVDIWATSRNSILTNFLFVYLLINPWLGFFCENPEGFFAGATLTASLDLMRHSRINLDKIRLISVLTPWLSYIFVSPKAHHRHHHALAPAANFGANFIIWDKLFDTFCQKELSFVYQDPTKRHPLQQLFYPLRLI